MILNNSLFANWSQEILKALNDSNSQYIALLNIDGKLLYANKAFSRLYTGELYQNFLNPTFDDFIVLKDKQPYVFGGHITIGNNDKLNSSIEGKVYFNNDEFLVVGSLNTKELNANNAVLHKLNRQVNSLQRDLIKEKAMLEKTMADLQIVNDDLELANASKDRFFSIISHDLFSPFNAIIGFSQLLINNIKTESYNNIEKFAGIINESSVQTVKLLRNLIDWSKMHSGKMEFYPITFNFQEFLSSFLPLLENIALQKSITIINTNEFNESITADKSMLETIIRNLISNAIKFTPEGGVITIKYQVKESMFQLSIEDNGVGIPEENSKKIFAIDNNYSTIGTNNEKGTGLGLILCNDFVQAHKGNIWVESKVGLGSKFIFAIPLMSLN